MKFTSDLSDDAVLKEIGNRINQYRLNQDKTQAVLAHDAGVSNRTMTRIEHGDSVQASSIIRILRALQLLENLDALIPEPAVSPVQQLKMQGKKRQRASSKSTKAIQEEPWSWGDEE
jgi:transcriptional regulator with XRE-family HTH domain